MDQDPKVMFKTSTLWSAGHPENYIFQVDFSTSDLSLEEDEKTESRKSKQRLVLIHGYGASGLMFYRCCDLLRREFRLTTIDLLGMGGSGRPPFEVETSRDAVSFFIHSIEAWIRKQEKINSSVGVTTTGVDENEQIVLMGHSLGGFISGHFCLRYPERVK